LFQKRLSAWIVT